MFASRKNPPLNSLTLSRAGPARPTRRHIPSDKHGADGECASEVESMRPVVQHVLWLQPGACRTLFQELLAAVTDKHQRCLVTYKVIWSSIHRALQEISTNTSTWCCMNRPVVSRSQYTASSSLWQRSVHASWTTYVLLLKAPSQTLTQTQTWWKDMASLGWVREEAISIWWSRNLLSLASGDGVFLNDLTGLGCWWQQSGALGRLVSPERLQFGTARRDYRKLLVFFSPTDSTSQILSSLLQNVVFFQHFLFSPRESFMDVDLKKRIRHILGNNIHECL